MPIEREEFDRLAADRGVSTNPERVLQFLVRNRDQAFRASEIATATGVDENSVHPVLSRLKERELVRHERPYWAVGDLEAVRDAFVHHSTVTFLDDVLGSESREEWLDATDKNAGDE